MVTPKPKLKKFKDKEETFKEKAKPKI